MDSEQHSQEAVREHAIRALPRLTSKAQRALWTAFDKEHPGRRDPRGYLDDWTDNLLPGITPEDSKADMEGGSGNELESKFKAVHSSSALAVNTFAPCKRKPGSLVLCGIEGLTFQQFEKKLPTKLRGATPNLDGFATSNTHVVGIESKLLEFLTPKRMKVSKSYHRERFPDSEDCWWEVLEEYRDAQIPRVRLLDVAQLVKHYLGLTSHDFGDRQVCLIYLFWEPENTAEYSGVFETHREEIAELAERVSDSRVEFKWISYPELWAGWDSAGILPEHVEHLRARYSVSI